MEDEATGKAKGGLARAAKLTPEERSDIAKKAAVARWERGEPILKATHEGPLNISGIKIPAYVLEDGTRILSQRGLQQSIGLSRSGGKDGARRVSIFMVGMSNKGIEINDLHTRVNNPVMFMPLRGPLAHGYEATILADICDAVFEAHKQGKLLKRQEHLAVRCEILMRGFAKVGIVALVDEATGYQEIRPKDALQSYLELIVRKELAAWAKKFPDEFYENIYKLKGWKWPGMQKNRFSVVAYYTRDLVYERIAPGLLQELEHKTPKDEKGRRKHKMQQWLTEDVGDPMLAQHLHSLVMFQRLALSSGYGWNRFLRMVDKVLPKKGATLELPFIEDL